MAGGKPPASHDYSLSMLAHAGELASLNTVTSHTL